MAIQSRLNLAIVHIEFPPSMMSVVPCHPEDYRIMCPSMGQGRQIANAKPERCERDIELDARRLLHSFKDRSLYQPSADSSR